MSTMVNVHPDAKIGENVVIEPFSTIYENVEIGEGTWVGPNVTIMSGARIGKNCKIFPGAVVSAVPQDLKFEGEETTTEVGDNVTIRECVTINRGTKAKNKTVIGNNCLLMSYVHVAHDCIIGNNVILGGYTGLAGEVEVADHAIFGGGSLAHQFVRVGEHCFIQGGSKVGKDVPPFIIAGREPLCYAGLNVVGLRRRGFSNEKIDEIHNFYRIIYQKGLNNTDAVKHIEEAFPESKERDTVVDFIKASKRGIIKGIGD